MSDLVEDFLRALTRTLNGDPFPAPPARYRPIRYRVIALRDPLQDCLLAGRYRIASRLGKGAMAIVYKAIQEPIDRVVAIKILNHSFINDQYAVKRFKLEAKTLSALRHKNILSVHDLGNTEEGQPFFVMEFLDGISLERLIENRGPVPVARAVPIFAQICDGLSYAHNEGVIHRDLKPANVMLVAEENHDETVKLVDFGIVKVSRKSQLLSQQLTRQGEIWGSPIYMSPEQCMGTTLDARSDIYSLGLLMYETLLGVPAVSGGNIAQIVTAQMSKMPCSFKEAVPALRIPEALEEIVFRALAKKPEERFRSMAEVKASLEAFAGPYGIKLRKTTGVTSQSNRAYSGGAGGAGVGDSSGIKGNESVPALTPVVNQRPSPSVGGSSHHGSVSPSTHNDPSGADISTFRQDGAHLNSQSGAPQVPHRGGTQQNLQAGDAFAGPSGQQLGAAVQGNPGQQLGPLASRADGNNLSGTEPTHTLSESPGPSRKSDTAYSGDPFAGTHIQANPRYTSTNHKIEAAKHKHEMDSMLAILVGLGLLVLGGAVSVQFFAGNSKIPFLNQKSTQTKSSTRIDGKSNAEPNSQNSDVNANANDAALDKSAANIQNDKAVDKTKSKDEPSSTSTETTKSDDASDLATDNVNLRTGDVLSPSKEEQERIQESLRKEERSPKEGKSKVEQDSSEEKSREENLRLKREKEKLEKAREKQILSERKKDKISAKSKNEEVSEFTQLKSSEHQGDWKKQISNMVDEASKKTVHKSKRAVLPDDDESFLEGIHLKRHHTDATQQWLDVQQRERE